MVVVDLNEGAGQETVDLIRRQGGSTKAVFVKADVSKEKDVENVTPPPTPHWPPCPSSPSHLPLPSL